MAERRPAEPMTTEELLDGQVEGELIEVDEQGNIVPHRSNATGATPERKSVVLHDPHGEYADRMLVTRDLVVGPAEARANRWWVEQEKLRRHFPRFRLVGGLGTVCSCVGTIVSNSNRSYGIVFTVPPRYPYEMPAVQTSGWRVTAGCPHCYGGSTLCLMRPDQWRSAYTLAFLVAKTAIWIAKYEVWLVTARWPGSDQHGVTPPRQRAQWEETGFWAVLAKSLGL